MVKVDTQEVIIKTSDGKSQVTAIVSYEYDPKTCKGTIISIRAKTPNATFGFPWKIGIGVGAEITMSAGSLTGKSVECYCAEAECEGRKCDFVITASWTVRVKLTIGILLYDETKTGAGSGTFSTECICKEGPREF